MFKSGIRLCQQISVNANGDNLLIQRMNYIIYIVASGVVIIIIVIIIIVVRVIKKKKKNSLSEYADFQNQDNIDEHYQEISLNECMKSEKSKN